MRNDDFIGQGFCWFTGIVQDINDPEDLNRVKVYCIGYHPEKVKLEELPWATVMMPTTSASTEGIGANHHLEPTSWVVGFFRDGTSAQDPIVMGSIATQNQVKNPIRADGKDVPVGSSTTNKVYNSKAGHKIELENKKGDETIRVTHAKGAQIIIDKDNNIAIVTEGKLDISAVGELKFFSSKKTIIV